MLIRHESLRAATRAILQAGGSDEAEAEIVTDHLVEAHLKGHPSHGVGMIPRYFEALHRGELRPNRTVTVEQDSGPVLVVDGGSGYGHAMARQATELAIAKAGREGVALLALKNCCHIGRVGTYGEMCAAAGLVSMHFVNAIGRTPLVAPHRGTDPRVATNPVVFAVPAAGDTPAFVLDMATSRIAMGKARVAMMRGDDLGEGYVLDAEGKPTQDPGVMFASPHGALMPLGAHKGYGLAMVCEFLAGALTGGGTIQPGNLRTDTTINNMFVVVLDPGRFGDTALMREEIAAVTAYAKASPPADPDEPVLVAGEPERMSREALLDSGIEIDGNSWEAILAAAESVGITRQRIAEICDEA